MKRARMLAVCLAAALPTGGAARAEFAGKRDASSGNSRATFCPSAGGSEKTWGESEGASPPEHAAVGHLAAPPAESAPMLVSAHGESFWTGLSYRSGKYRETRGNPDCFLAGTAAFYYVGRENDPEFDFVKAVSEGREGELGLRLLELRWFDAESKRRMRWINRALADRLGWFTDGRGERHEDAWPIPLPQAVNALH